MGLEVVSKAVRGIASWGRTDGDDRQCAAGSPRRCMNFLSLLFKYCLQEVRLHVSPFYGHACIDYPGVV